MSLCASFCAALLLLRPELREGSWAIVPGKRSCLLWLGSRGSARIGGSAFTNERIGELKVYVLLCKNHFEAQSTCQANGANG